MEMVVKNGGVDIKATFDLLDQRISALENKDKPAPKTAGKLDWTPTAPKKA
jgi:hypothetical protein